MGGRDSASGLNKGVNSEDWGQFMANSDAAADDLMGLGNGGAADQWMGSLSMDERGAINVYTGSSHEQMNKHLRKGEYISPENQARIDSMTKSLDGYNLYHAKVFERGSTASFFDGASTVEELSKMVGQVKVDKGFTSSSVKRGGSFSSKPITIHIKAGPGKGIGAYVKGMSQFEGENEFLFNRGSAFKIVGVYADVNGKPHVNMEYVGNER